MKTTLDLNDELLEKASALSIREHKSLTTVIEEGLRLRLRYRPSTARKARRPIAVYRGKGGLVRDVGGLSNRSLLEAADAQSSDGEGRLAIPPPEPRGP